MKKTFYAVPALMLAACATTPESSMSPAELAECLQPNRRVVVEVVGRTVKPPAKKPAAPPAEAKPATATAKPEAAAEAKPEAKPKPAKPEFVNFEETFYIQGNTAFEPSSAVLKEGGKQEVDALLAVLKKRAVDVGAIIVAGHTDRLEAARGNKELSEQRARAVKDYLVERGANEKLIFWEGKQETTPVPVTKFCT
jgi:outer membrane protein OmpA-like peptidoglycan-associated protein